MVFRYLLFVIAVTMMLFGLRTFATQTIDVIAVEFPPLTTSSSKHSGKAFELLNEKTAGHSVTWKANFYPPARASKIISSGEWCASFYPIFADIAHRTAILSQSPVKFGLIRKAQSTSFNWTSLTEFKGQNVALLREKSNPPFYQQFRDAGVNIVYIETISGSIEMVLHNRVELAVADESTFSAMKKENRDKLQLSDSSLLEIPIALYVNEHCAEDVAFLFDDILEPTD